MAQKFSQWLSVLAVVTLMMTLVPLGSAAPVDAWSGTNVRDENVLRTGGVSRVTYDGTGMTNPVGAGTTTAATAETVETNSIAELDRQSEIGTTQNWGTRNSTGTVADSQIIRIRASFFKNNTNTDIPVGGAPEISGAYIQLRDRGTGEFAYIKLTRGANGAWDTAAAVNAGTQDDKIVVFCRRADAGRRWAVNDLTQAVYNQNAEPGNPAAGDKDTAEISCGSGDRPFLSPVEFAIGNTVESATASNYGVTGNNSDTLNISVQFAFPTPEVMGPIEVWTSVEDDDQYADGWDLFTTVQMGDTPTVTGAPFTGVGSTSVAAGSNIDVFVSVEDKDTEADVRAVIATLVASGGRYVQIIFFHQVDQVYGTPGTPGTGTSISISDIEDRYQVYDGDRGRYLPNKPTDTGTITTSLGVLDVASSSFNTSGDRVTVTFRFTPNASAVGTATLFGQGVDREGNSSGLRFGGTFTIRAS